MRKYKERVELHCHTGFSRLDGTASVKDIVDFATSQGMTSVAFTDHGNVTAYPEIQYYCKHKEGFKPIYGLEAYVVDDIKKCSTYHVTVLAKNKRGIHAIYKLITDSNLKYFNRYPRIRLSELLRNRENLIIGSGCVAGLLSKAIIEKKRTKDIEIIASLFDYLEIQPVDELLWMIESDKEVEIKTRDDITALIEKIVLLGEKLDKPVVAMGDVHFLRPENAIGRAVLKEELGFEKSAETDSLYFRTTEEMLSEFTFLGEEKAYEVVVENTNHVAEQIDILQPIENIRLSYSRQGDYERLEKLCTEGLKRVYGNDTILSHVPDDVCERLNKELAFIKGNENAYMYLYFYELIKSNKLNLAQYSLRGSAASMLVCYLLGISHSDPLDPEISLYSEFFIGFKGDKIPDIDINVDMKIHKDILESIKTLPGIKTAYRVGTFSTISDEKTDWMIKRYEKYEEPLTDKQKEIVKHDMKCVFSSRELHPGKMVIIPENWDETIYTPICIDEEGIEQVFQFDYYSVDQFFEKLDIISHDTCTLNSRMYEITGYYPTDDDIKSAEIMSLLTSTEALGIKNGSDNGAKTGLLGIPGLMNEFTLNLVKILKPKSFAELVKIEAISHGTNVWIENGEILFANGTVDLSNMIGTREDVYEIMSSFGIEQDIAFKIAESVRKGMMSHGAMSQELINEMVKHNVPDWVIWSCGQICYLFPRAHAVENVQMELRSLYYKLHYPKEYYSLFFEIYGNERVKEYVVAGEAGFKAMNYYIMSNPNAKKEDVLFFNVWKEMILRTGRYV